MQLLLPKDHHNSRAAAIPSLHFFSKSSNSSKAANPLPSSKPLR